MKLTEILNANRVVAGITVTSKKRALEEMSKLLAKGSGTVTEGEIFTALTAREKLGSTGLGHGVAIPHGRMSGVEGSIGALIRLKHLAAIAELFSDEAFCKQARAAADDAALFALIASRT